MSAGFHLQMPTEALECLADQVAARLAEQIGPPPESYIDADEAADYLACKKKRINELKEAGRIPCYRDGRRLLFKRSDLDAYVAKG